MKSLLILLCSVCSVSVFAQLPGGSAAFSEGNPEGLVVGARVEDWARPVKDGPRSENFDLIRMLVTAQISPIPGLELWGEGGWNGGELVTESDGGVTWGLGLGMAPWRSVRRSDPEWGPRDWVALRFDVAVRGGSSSTDDEDMDWTSYEGRLGVRWHQRYSMARRGPVYSTALMLEGGVQYTALSVEEASFDGESEQDFGLYGRVLYHFLPNSFLGLELDWFGTSDRKAGIVAGVTF